MTEVRFHKYDAAQYGHAYYIEMKVKTQRKGLPNNSRCYVGVKLSEAIRMFRKEMNITGEITLKEF